jgi:glycosyltransferase involved in cell wall biosynthesis
MKVLHLLDSLYRAGAEMQALDICRNANANGLDMAFAALGGGALEEDFRNSGVEFIRLQRRFPIDPFVVNELRRFIRKNNIDIVHAHQAVDGLHAYLATVGTDVKRVLSFHGHFSDFKNRLAIKYLVPRMSANISCSNGLLPWLIDEGIDTSDFRVIYNGVDLKRLEYNGPSLRDELGISANSLIFGMVAHFHPAPRKDQITLCRAFVKFAAKERAAHLVIVGKPVGDEGQKKFEICQAVCREGGVIDRVHFLGQRDDLAKIVHGLDIYIFSSLHEGLPIALMEAMLSKKPTILSDIAPHLEVSHSGEYAMTFKTQDADDLTEKMLALASSSDLRTKLAESAYRYAVSTFSIETHIHSLKNLYSELLKNQTV